MGSIALEELSGMAGSSEDVCNNKISNRCYDDTLALVPSTDTSLTKNNGKRQESEQHPAESPPNMACARDGSPDNVMDAAGQPFRVRLEGPKLCAQNGRSNNRGKETFSCTNVNETAADMAVPELAAGAVDVAVATAPADSSDTSSRNILSNNIAIPRARARAIAKPARFRQSIEAETSITNTKKPKKKASATSDRNESIADARGTMAPPPKNAKTGTWTDKEQQQFKVGCVRFGWGSWCAIANCVPTRTRSQVKSHAQKFQKHHPGEKIGLEREFKHLCKKRYLSTEKNAKAGAKERKVQRARKVQRPTAAPINNPSKSKKRYKPRELDAPRKPAKAPKRVSPTKELKEPSPTKELKTPIYKAGTVGLSTNFTPSDTKISKPERKRFQALSKAAPQSTKGKAALHENGSPGAGAWTFTEQEQFKDGCILYGWGNWSSVESCIPTRTNAQVKSHAQKFQKHHPEEKQRIEICVLIKRRALAVEAIPQSKKKLAAKRPSPTKNRKAHAKGNDTPSRGSWSFTEKKQFEDGCIFHGWGRWEDVAGHIPTRNRSQVKSHAQKYQIRHAEKRERLESEHERHLHAGRETSTQNTLAAGDKTKVHQLLLGVVGGALGKEAKPRSLLTPESKGKNHQSHINHVLSSQRSTHKTTVDDYGAAEAILALNSARWDVDKNRREAELPSPKEIDLNETSSSTSSFKANDNLSKNEDVYACEDSHKFEDPTN